ncbi:flavin reductase family protein [Solimicrobium silvestre]|uniref:Flavin reductase like domain n=1 Tax=Solimicrobium silvestre TaxID=2099400 RepID=A0A2S9H578_9BURK|nr:flavin reductase family protein [Solimicrobium silvestre]PRC95091.1 Flavin reductase like domain [Solimicrobium silvestre]
MNFDPQKIEPRHCYQLLVGSIIPRPIAWISTLSVDGVLNLAPYSFFTVASCNPPVLLVTQVNPSNQANKDTLTNLKATKECVVNIVSNECVAAMNASCADYPSDVSEFIAVGIDTVASLMVAPAGVKATQVRFECTLREVIEVSAMPAGGTMMLLDVVNIYVNEMILQENQIAPELLDAIGKLGGDYYSTTRDSFKLVRPAL